MERNSRIDILISDLCDEIDYKNDQIKTLTEDRDYWRDLYNNHINTQIKNNMEMVGKILKHTIIDPITDIKC